MKEQMCIVCNKKAEQLCGRCQVARYCSRDHQKEHWKIHKNSCFPCRIECNNVIGRHLVASRDIKAGETIISDPPLVVGPQFITKPVCLGCNGPVNGKHTCDDCGYPICKSGCPNIINHKRECELIQMGGKRARVQTGNRVNPMYQCITPLRCLWMKLKAKDKWDKLIDMESHYQERKKSGKAKAVKNCIVYTIRKYFQLDMFSEDEIQKVCGILETNGYEVPDLNLSSLYAFGYLLEHSCVPNTTRTFNAMLHLVVTAAVDIKAGEHITTSYINPFWGERIRKVHLMNFKYFSCSCPRCVDPTDLNTHLSSVKCNACPNGLLTPPHDIASQWRCDSCETSVDACEVEQTLVDIYKQKEKLTPIINSFEKFLKETRRLLSENHHCRMETKLALLQMYGRGKDMEMSMIPDDEIIRKKTLCEEVLSLANLFAPGLSRIRGIILFELQATYTEQFRRLHKKFKNSTEGRALIEKAEEILTEAVQILKLETHLQEEIQMAAEGEEQLSFIRALKDGKINDQPKTKIRNRRK